MLWRARTPSGGQDKYVKEKQHCVKVRKGSHGMIEIKLLCFRRQPPMISSQLFFLLITPIRAQRARKQGPRCIGAERSRTPNLINIPPMKTEQTECSETSAYKTQTPGNH
jgi:hypothetical protein